MKLECIVPKNMVDFQCVGNQCEDTCCMGWGIHIDKETYLKYKNIEDKRLRESIIEKLSLLDKDSNSSHAKINLKEGRCPFLENGLCSIQNRFGHQHLSDTCKKYPRKVFKIHDLHEMSYSLSCPEVVRKLILDPNPMEFNREILELDIEVQNIIYDDTSIFHKYFWEIRSLAIDIMQSRHIDINTRIVILGMFLSSISTAIDINKVIVEYNFIIKNPEEIIKELSKLEAPDNYFKELFEIIYNVIKTFMENKKEPWLEPIKSLFVMKYDDIFENFIKVYKNQFASFNKNTDYIIENIAVYYIYHWKIPLPLLNLSIIDRYNFMLFHIFFYRIFVVLHYLKYGDFNFELWYYIQKVAKLFGHNEMFNDINRMFKNKDTDFVHLIPLIVI